MTPYEAELDERLAGLCAAAISERVFPGCVLGYVRDGRMKVLRFGKLTYDADAPSVTAETVYDLASLTKSVVTSSLILRLVEAGQISLDDHVTQYLPEMDNPDRAGMTVQHLLTYTMVLDLDEGLADVARDFPDRLMDVVLKAPLKAPPGRLYHYTNTPAILLGLIAERVLGKPIDVAAGEQLFEPLGMKDTSFSPAHIERVAPTEIDERGELRGVVHDETAWALQRQGMTAGCAGLFGTAGDLLKFTQMLLAEGEFEGNRYFGGGMVRQMYTNQLESIEMAVGLGWEIDRPDVMGIAQAPGMIMKSGFSGCWMAMDVDRSIGLVHLSNRTYPKRVGREPINSFWRGMNEAFFLS